MVTTPAMPLTYSSIEKIRADLAWVNETPIQTNAAAVTFDVVRKRTPDGCVPRSGRNEVLDFPAEVLLCALSGIRMSWR